MGRAEARAKEQRRSRRYKVAVPVLLSQAGAPKTDARTVDVCRHGLFVATDSPPKERFLVQLSLQLPDGPLNTTAFVSRAVAKDGPSVPGVGLQLFALSAASKERWDRFLFSLGAEPATAPMRARLAHPEEATFLIKLKDVARLEEFLVKNVQAGGLYMATPVIKETGAELALVLIHPLTEAEFVLLGTVERVCRERPKGMEIKLRPLEPREQAALAHFVRTGLAPDQGPRPPVPPRPPGQEEEISIDIVVDESALEDSPRFDWSEISDNDKILDFELREETPGEPILLATAVAGPSTAPEGPASLELRFEEPTELEADGALTAPGPPPTWPQDQGAEDLPAIEAAQERPPQPDALERALAEVRAPAVAMRLGCALCQTVSRPVELGAPPGPLASVAELKPYWCSTCSHVVGVLRPHRAKERRALSALLLAAAPDAQVPLALLLEVAESFGGPPRCPDCGGGVKSNARSEGLGSAARRLGEGERTDLTRASCAECGEHGLYAERVR